MAAAALSYASLLPAPLIAVQRQLAETKMTSFNPVLRRHTSTRTPKLRLPAQHRSAVSMENPFSAARQLQRDLCSRVQFVFPHIVGNPIFMVGIAATTVVLKVLYQIALRNRDEPGCVISNLLLLVAIIKFMGRAAQDSLPRYDERASTTMMLKRIRRQKYVDQDIYKKIVQKVFEYDDFCINFGSIAENDKDYYEQAKAHLELAGGSEKSV